MSKLYYLVNNYISTLDQRQFEPTLIGRISGHGVYIRIVNRDKVADLEFNLEPSTKKIISVGLIGTKNVRAYQYPFPVNSLLELQKTITIDSNEMLEKFVAPKFLSFLGDVKVGIYKDAIIFWLYNPNFFQARYLLTENDMLSVLTDKNFNVLAFITWNLSDEEMKEFKFDIGWERRNIKFVKEEPHLKVESILTMKNQNCLIKKINELKNINLIDLLFYAYDKKLIDDQFLIDYAIAQLESGSNNKDPFILELAGLLDSEINKAGKLLEVQVKNNDEVLYEKGQHYNKIWFYLTLAADMCAEKIID